MNRAENKGREWTAADDEYIRSQHGRSGFGRIARRLGRTYISVAQRCVKLGLRANKKTAVGDVIGVLTVLRLRRRRMSAKKVETFAVVRCECGSIHETRLDRLRGGCSPCWCRQTDVTLEQRMFIRDNYADMLPGEIANVLGIERASVATVARQDGLERDWTCHGQREMPVGTPFGAWTTVSEPIPGRDGAKWAVRVRCRCGKEAVRRGNRLLSGLTMGCKRCTTRKNPYRVTAWGETKLVVEWLEDPRCSPRTGYTVRNRIRIGWAAEDALSTPAVRGRPPAKITAWGVTKTLKRWLRDPLCKARCTSTVRYRLSSGWTPEKALGTPTRKRRRPAVS